MTSDRDLFALSLCDLLLLLQLVSTEMQRRLVGPAQPPVFEPPSTSSTSPLREGTCVHFCHVDLGAFFNIFWNHFHSLNPLSTSFSSYFPVLDILHFTGDVSGMSICKSSFGPWLEFEPSAIEQFWPNAERFTDVWAMTYFCTATCSLLAIYRLMKANFQQFFCWVADFIFQPVVMQVCGELQRSSVVHVQQNWFFALRNYHSFRPLQPGSVIFPWSQTSRELGINSVSCQPTDSGSIAIVGLYRMAQLQL